MGPRQSTNKQKSNNTLTESKSSRSEFIVTEPPGAAILTLSKPIYQRLLQFLSIRDTVRVAILCKTANNNLLQSSLDCFDVQFPLPKLLVNFSLGYWKLTGMSVKLIEGETLAIPKDAVGVLRKLRVKCQLVDLKSLAGCSALENLIVTWCRGLVDVSGIQHCKNLLSASLVGCTFTNVSAFAHCSLLRSLDLSGAEELKNVNGLGNCRSLSSLRLHNCVSLVDLSGISTSTSLTTLNLSGCVNLGDISPLSTIVPLRDLNLSNNLTLSDISRLVVLPNLVTLDLSSNRELREVNVLAACPALEVLNISCCFRVTDWSELSNCATLRTVSTGGLVASENRSSVSYSTTSLVRQQRFG